MKITDINSKEKFGYSCIYLFTNLVNEKKYVGQSQNCYQRMKQYIRIKKPRRLFERALIKYGFNNFELTLLEFNIPNEELDRLEQYWMDYYKSYDLTIGYNLCSEAKSTRGYNHTEEDKLKMSKIAKQRFIEHPEYIKKGKDNPMYGKKLSQETRQKMSNSRLNNQNAKGHRWKLSQKTKEKISESMKGKQNCLGRVLSDETKRKISESNHRRIMTEETREKQRKSHLGKFSKKVRCIETNIIYSSIGEAANAINKDVSGIGKCCNGKQKTCGGYHWEFVNQ